jgi:hypothetical protein
LAFWTNQLASGFARPQVADEIANSTEDQTQLINDAYFQYLGRAADPTGLAYWIDQLTAGESNEDLIVGFTGSPEYYSQHTG